MKRMLRCVLVLVVATFGLTAGANAPANEGPAQVEKAADLAANFFAAHPDYAAGNEQTVDQLAKAMVRLAPKSLPLHEAEFLMACKAPVKEVDTALKKVHPAVFTTPDALVVLNLMLPDKESESVPITLDNYNYSVEKAAVRAYLALKGSQDAYHALEIAYLAADARVRLVHDQYYSFCRARKYFELLQPHQDSLHARASINRLKEFIDLDQYKAIRDPTGKDLSHIFDAGDCCFVDERRIAAREFVQKHNKGMDRKEVDALADKLAGRLGPLQKAPPGIRDQLLPLALLQVSDSTAAQVVDEVRRLPLNVLANEAAMPWIIGPPKPEDPRGLETKRNVEVVLKARAEESKDPQVREKILEHCATLAGLQAMLNKDCEAYRRYLGYLKEIPVERHKKLGAERMKKEFEGCEK